MEQTECCLGGIRLSGVLRPKQVASVGAQTKTRAWAFRLSSSCLSSVSHACCKWLPPPAVPYHTPLRARLSTPNNDPVARNAQYITNKYDATDDCCADSRDKDGTCRTILGFLRERMDVRRSKIDHRLNGGIQTFKRHDKRTADDNSRPFASVESQPRAKHSYCNGSSEMDAHVPLALHRRGNA